MCEFRKRCKWHNEDEECGCNAECFMGCPGLIERRNYLINDLCENAELLMGRETTKQWRQFSPHTDITAIQIWFDSQFGPMKPSVIDIVLDYEQKRRNR